MEHNAPNVFQTISDVNFGPYSRTHYGHVYNNGERLSPDAIKELKEEAILASLVFPEMQTRYAQVDGNCDETLQWLLENEIVDDTGTYRYTTHHHFPEWLTGQSGGFLILGKPGSGKSTCIEFLEQSAKTNMMLKQWARNCEATLLTASHSFWCSGTELQ